MLVELFERHHTLDTLPAFVSGNARRIYRITPPPKTVTLARQPWVVPERYGEVVPFQAGVTLEWQVLGG